MPELPEIEALTRDLDAHTQGAVVRDCHLTAISALKTYKPSLDDIKGRISVSWSRQGKYLVWELENLWMVVHLSRGGWVRWHDAMPTDRPKVGRGPLALRVGLDSGAGFDVTEMGHEKRLALWLFNDLSQSGELGRLGPDPLDPEFNEERLAGMLEGQSPNLKTLLTRQDFMTGVGNAYSDEVLHAARLSPFKSASKLSGAEIGRLYAALTAVLNEAVGKSVGLSARELKSEKKRSMRVHGRTGQACPTCGDTVRQVAFATKSLQYCPTCQTGGKTLADRRLSRLLK